MLKWIPFLISLWQVFPGKWMPFISYICCEACLCSKLFHILIALVETLGNTCQSPKGPLNFRLPGSETPETQTSTHRNSGDPGPRGRTLQHCLGSWLRLVTHSWARTLSRLHCHGFPSSAFNTFRDTPLFVRPPEPVHVSDIEVRIWNRTCLMVKPRIYLKMMKRRKTAMTHFSFTDP